jgi:hypothetical protein
MKSLDFLYPLPTQIVPESDVEQRRLLYIDPSEFTICGLDQVMANDDPDTRRLLYEVLEEEALDRCRIAYEDGDAVAFERAASDLFTIFMFKRHTDPSSEHPEAEPPFDWE